MKPLILIFSILFVGESVFAQTPANKSTLLLQGDSVKVTNCDSAELIIENHTQNVPGFLFNTGNGRTIFKRGVVKINDSLFLIGGDTLKVPKAVTNAWLQGGNTWGATGVLGTLDNNHLDLFSNDTQRVRLTNTGNLDVGGTTDNGSKLQVNGASYFNGPQLITGTSNATVNQYAYTLHTPTITGLPGTWNYFYDVRLNPTMVFSSNNQLGFALDVSPNYTLNGFSQSSGIPSAIHVGCSMMGGVTIEQNSSYGGNPGQPLYIAQGAGADKEAVQIYRNGVPTTKPIIWNNDARPSATNGIVIPVIRNSINTTSGGVGVGGGISYTMDRYYSQTEASIEMKYEQIPTVSAPSNIKTAISFNTADMSNYTSPALYISGSKIGIGTTTPSAQLNTTGSVRFAGLTNDSTQTRVLVSDVNGNLFYRSASSIAINGILNSNLAENPTINSSLAVNGEIRAQRLRLSQYGWPDYVFAGGYHLPSLSELEQYIQQQHHLPGMASAAEVEKKGIDVGDNQAALLKKVEELTLYAIEQEKILQTQQAEIAKLKEQNKDLQSLKKEMAELRKLIRK